MRARKEAFVPLLRRPQHDSPEYKTKKVRNPYETGERPIQHQVWEWQEDSVSQHDPRRSWTRCTDPREIPRLIEVNPYRESRERLDAIEAGFRFLQHRREHQTIKFNTLESTSRQRTPPSREMSSPQQGRFPKKYQTLRQDRVAEDEAAPLLTHDEQEPRDFLRNEQERVVALEGIEHNKLAYEQVEGEERLYPSSTERERINVEKHRSHQRLSQLLAASAKMESLSTITFPSDRSLVGGSDKTSSTGRQMYASMKKPAVPPNVLERMKRPAPQVSQILLRRDRERAEELHQMKETKHSVALSDSLQAFLKEFMSSHNPPDRYGYPPP